MRNSTLLRFRPGRCLHQMQHAQLMSQQHGGLFAPPHQNAEELRLEQQRFAAGRRGGNDASAASAALPSPDLTHTPVHEGLGTSASDPFTRTLPNQPLKPQVATVYVAPEDTPPSAEELRDVGTKWGPLSYWFGGRYPRLQLYIRSKCIDVPPVPASANQQLDAFVTKALPELSLTPSGELVAGAELLAEQWRAFTSKFQRLPLDAHDPDQFLARLTPLQEEAQQLFRHCDADGLARVRAVSGLLTQRAIARRNERLEELLAGLTRHSAFIAAGDAVWAQLLRAFEERIDLLADGSDAVVAMWERAQRATRPHVKAPVAVLLATIAVELAQAEGTGRQQQQQAGAVASLVGHIPGAVCRDRAPVPCAAFPHLGAEELARLLRPILLEQFRAPTPALAARLYDLRLFAAHGLARLLLARERLIEDEVADAAKVVAAYFDESTEGARRLLRMGKAAAVRDRVWAALGLAAKRDNTTQHLVESLGWPSRRLEHLGRLLADEKIRTAMRDSLSAERKPGWEKATEGIDRLSEQLRAIEKEAEARQRQCAQLLSAPDALNATIALLGGLEVPLDAVRAANDAEHRASLVSLPSPAPLLADILHEVSSAHPHWALDGIVPTDLHTISDAACFEAVRVAFRILLRLTCPPQAGEAALKARFRRRIGPVRVDEHCVNLPVEVGVAESYDNQMYKQYDHQGWYQRMRDVYFRNVSLRCRLADLRRLDAHGRPYLDLQTERRLRILAEHRVGAGTLKLDSDRFEDQSDNLDFGTSKLLELMAEAKKAQLGREYWPTVEVKVRNPSGQSTMHYSVADWDRIERRSARMYERYRDLKKSQLFVRPTDTWLKVEGGSRVAATVTADDDGYTVDDLMNAMDGGGSGGEV